MKKFILAAAFALASVSAQAGNSFSFNVEGHRVRVHVPTNCYAISCISVSAPGLVSKDDDEPVKPRASKSAPAPDSAAAQPAPAAVSPATSAPAPVAAAPAAVAPATAPAASSGGSNITYIPAPEPQSAAVAAPAPAPVDVPAPVAAQPKPAPTVMASAPAMPETKQPAAATSPLGLWMTEKKEGKVRIEACGQNLCGYAINDKTGAKGEQVLINMKPRDNKWTGRIHDTRGGGTYDSTIAMKGANALSVKGCAFGGMFCGGQTWTRIE